MFAWGGIKMTDSETAFEKLTIRVCLGGLLLMGILTATAITQNETMRYLSAAGLGAIAWPLFRWYRALLED
jgi:hypothetical protein